MTNYNSTLCTMCNSAIYSMQYIPENLLGKVIIYQISLFMTKHFDDVCIF